MRWLAKLIYRLNNKGRRYSDQDGDKMYGELQAVKTNSPSFPDDDLSNPMHVTVYTAKNGKIIRFTSYDQTKGQHKQAVYIVGSDENFDECFQKYMAMEALRHV